MTPIGWEDGALVGDDDDDDDDAGLRFLIPEVPLNSCCSSHTDQSPAKEPNERTP